MAKKIIVCLSLLIALATPKVALADGGTRQVCTTVYGGGTECKEEKIPEVTHEVSKVNTGWVENTALAVVVFAAGYVLMLKANKLAK
jgi:hypothetical protein